jgi:hypothetical protein
MKKEIIKCDNCGKIIDDNKETYYYHIYRDNLPRWSSIDYSMGADTNWHICHKCFKKSGLKKRNNKK